MASMIACRCSDVKTQKESVKKIGHKVIRLFKLGQGRSWHQHNMSICNEYSNTPLYPNL